MSVHGIDAADPPRHATTILLTGELDHEAPAGAGTDRARFDRHGYVVGRGAFPADALRQLRAPVVAHLIDAGLVEAVTGEPDRFRWTGDPTQLDPEALQELPDDLPLVSSGAVSTAVERLWGRRFRLWEDCGVFLQLPDREGYVASVHADAWHVRCSDGPGTYVNAWVPLTSIGRAEGGLALALGSDDPTRPGPEMVPVTDRPSLWSNTLRTLPAQAFDGTWATTAFELGDVLLFRPDLVHGSSPNHSEFVRLAAVFHGQDASFPVPEEAGLPRDPHRALTEVEQLLLAAMAADELGTQWPWREFLARGRIGERWGQAEPRVRQALELSIERGLAGARDSWTPPTITEAGRNELIAWLATPVAPSRDARPLLLLKILFSLELGSDPRTLLEGQRRLLADGPPRSRPALMSPWSEPAAALSDLWAGAAHDELVRLVDLTLATLEGRAAEQRH